MIYNEVCQDLFSVPDDYYLAHCISADYALGAGIAIEFNKRFDMRRKLRECYPNFGVTMKHYGFEGGCILIDNVLNLVTKDRYYNKPTYKSMQCAIAEMMMICNSNNIKKIAMPIIGCGLDRLQWDKVSEIIKNTFKNTDIEILVCKR